MKAGVFAIGLFAALGCNSEQPKPESPVVSQATAALKDLAERDAQLIAQCTSAVDACNARVADAAPSGACSRLAERCDALNERLDQVRGPAVHCWKAIQACENQAEDPTLCAGDALTCDSIDQDVSEARGHLVDCEARVQQCLIRVESLPEAALVSCDNVAAACDRVTAVKEAHDAAKAARGDAGATQGHDEDHEHCDEGIDGHDGNDDGTEQGDDADEPQSEEPEAVEGDDPVADEGKDKPATPRGRPQDDASDPADAGASSD
jgi:hypothetical protein